jgi:hypothetical protein
MTHLALIVWKRPPSMRRRLGAVLAPAFGRELRQGLRIAVLRSARYRAEGSVPLTKPSVDLTFGLGSCCRHPSMATYVFCNLALYSRSYSEASFGGIMVFVPHEDVPATLTPLTEALAAIRSQLSHR